MIRPLIGLVCLTVVTAAAAEPVRLSTEQLNQTVAGSVIALDTPIGTKIPMRFGTDGLVAGEAGVLAAFLGAAKDRGRWWVANDQLCIKWFRWFESQQRCMQIRAEGTHIFWRQDDGDTGTATLTERAKPEPVKSVAAVARPAPAVAAPKAAEQQVAANTTPAAESPRAAPAEAPAAVAGSVAAAVAGAAEAPVAEAAPAVAEAPAPAPVADTDANAPAVVAAELQSPETVSPARVESPPVATPAPGQAVMPKAPARRAPAAAIAKVAPAVTATAPSPSFRVAGVGEDDMLNIRNGPSEQHAAVGIISPRGRGVRITGACVDEWCPVRHGAMAGWVNRYYLTAE